MKKILTVLFCFIASGFVASARDYSSASRLDSIDRELADAYQRLDALDADYYRDYVWGRGRYSSIGFVLLGNTDSRARPREYSSFGFFLNQGTTYLFPRGKGFASFIKVGVDIRWVDLEITRYDPIERPLTFSSAKAPSSGSGLTRYPSELKFRRLAFLAGAFGFGPAVTIAPFSWADNGLASLKLNLYAHYQPTFGLCTYRATPCDSNGETLKNLSRGSRVNEIAYVHLVDFGVRVQWSRFSIGFEGRRGFGRFPDATYRWRPADPFPLNNDGTPYRRTFASTRLFFSYSF